MFVGSINSVVFGSNSLLNRFNSGKNNIFFKPSNQATKQPTNQATNQPSNQQINQPTNKLTNQPTISILDPTKFIKTAFQFARFDHPKSPEAHGSWRSWFLLSYVARPMGWMIQNIITHTIHVWYICLRLMLMVNVTKYISWDKTWSQKKHVVVSKLFIVVFESFKLSPNLAVTGSKVFAKESRWDCERGPRQPLGFVSWFIDEVQMERPRFLATNVIQVLHILSWWLGCVLRHRNESHSGIVFRFHETILRRWAEIHWVWAYLDMPFLSQFWV